MYSLTLWCAQLQYTMKWQCRRICPFTQIKANKQDIVIRIKKENKCMCKESKYTVATQQSANVMENICTNDLEIEINNMWHINNYNLVLFDLRIISGRWLVLAISGGNFSCWFTSAHIFQSIAVLSKPLVFPLFSPNYPALTKILNLMFRTGPFFLLAMCRCAAMTSSTWSFRHIYLPSVKDTLHDDQRRFK